MGFLIDMMQSTLKDWKHKSNCYKTQMSSQQASIAPRIQPQQDNLAFYRYEKENGVDNF